jgi:hypothetical protein
MQKAMGVMVAGSRGYKRARSCIVPRRQLRSLTRTLAPVILYWFVGSLNRACAQGAHDWGMWFGTLLFIGGAVGFILFLIMLVRWLKG